MNLIVAETRAIMEIALVDVNNWEEPDGNKIFPINNTLCWYKEEDIMELTDGRFAIPTVPTRILEIIGASPEKVSTWFETFNVIQVNDAQHLIKITEPEV